MIAQGFRNLDRVAKQLERVRIDVEGGKDKANRAAAAILRNKIRAELRKPGSGKEYRSRASRTNKALVADIQKLGGEIRGRLTKRQLKAKQRALRSSIGRLQKGLDRAGTMHRASAPGEAPAPDVGLLPQGVKVGVVDGTLRVGVGGEWQGWLALHEGRGRLKGRRPYMELGLARALPDMKDRVAAVLIEIQPGEASNG
jgi:hypothetical protein